MPVLVPVPVPRRAPMATAVNSEPVFVFGVPATSAPDAGRSAWSSLPGLPGPLRRFPCVAVGSLAVSKITHLYPATSNASCRRQT